MKALEVRRRLAVSILVAVAIPALAACFNPFDPRVSGVGVTEPPPVPDTPSNALRLLEWCYTHLALAEYKELFSDDYRFVFGALDPDGLPYRDNPFTREDEIGSATRLFHGGTANQPAAASIRLHLDRNFRVQDDPRYPTSGRWRKLVKTSVDLRVVSVEGSETHALGFGNFFLVRGDSALIPQELRDRGFGPDSNRWYVCRHEDDTMPPDENGLQAPVASAAARPPSTAGATSAPTAGLPARWSWGRIKAAYR